MDAHGHATVMVTLHNHKKHRNKKNRRNTEKRIEECIERLEKCLFKVSGC